MTRALDARTNRRGLVVRTRLADGHHELFGRDDRKADAVIRQHFEAARAS